MKNGSPFAIRLYERFLDRLPNWRVLDLGSGLGRETELFAHTAREVVAVDKKARDIVYPKNVRFVQASIQDYVNGLAHDETFQLVFMQNSLQFLDAKTARTVLRKIWNHISDGGVLAIKTFTKQPEPPMDLASLWSAADLLECLPNTYEIVETNTWNSIRPDMAGNNRMFYSLEFVVQKSTRLSV